MPVGMKLPSFNKFTGKTDLEEHIAKFQSQLSFQYPCSKVHGIAFPSSLAGPTLKWFNQFPKGCITFFEELKRQFTRTYVGSVRQDKHEHSLKTIKQRENEAISSFQDKFPTEFNLVLGADRKIAVITFVEGLKMSTFKKSLLKKRPSSLEDFNERAYKYIWIEETEKRAEKGRGKRPMEDTCRRRPEPKRRNALDRIPTPNRVRGKIEYLTPLNASARNVFMEIEDKRMLPRPPRQKTPPPQKQKGHEQLKEYVYKETQNVNKCFDRDRSRFPDDPPSVTGRVNFISRGRSWGGDSGVARRAYAKRDIYEVTSGVRPEFPDLFLRKGF
ncbi:hypothetical protein LIER_40286 [Lithospermum erythrorhizon]|uniref:Retrotransposon gag domain-containing protein n=1 Tax=Lithospermum erythrorhizon TaxID=34254 RepID=A0AAV3QS85_LITER